MCGSQLRLLYLVLFLFPACSKVLAPAQHEGLKLHRDPESTWYLCVCIIVENAFWIKSLFFNHQRRIIENWEICDCFISCRKEKEVPLLLLISRLIHCLFYPASRFSFRIHWPQLVSCPHSAYVYLMYLYWLAEQYDRNEGADPLLLLVPWHYLVP